MGAIFVTGLHRAGTHAYADYISKSNYIEEGFVRWDDFSLAVDLGSDNKIVHCPGLAHKTIELAAKGKVYWVTRNKLDLITSMRNEKIEVMAWYLMKQFRQQFPRDPIWETLTFSSEKNRDRMFIQYYELLIDVKMYFYKKYFKDYAEIIVTDDQPYYDKKTTSAYKRPLNSDECLCIRKA